MAAVQGCGFEGGRACWKMRDEGLETGLIVGC